MRRIAVAVAILTLANPMAQRTRAQSLAASHYPPLGRYMMAREAEMALASSAAPPHMMVFAPYYDNAMLGGNAVGAVPVVNDDAGTPFTVIVIPVDGALAIKARQK